MTVPFFMLPWVKWIGYWQCMRRSVQRHKFVGRLLVISGCALKFTCIMRFAQQLSGSQKIAIKVCTYCTEGRPLLASEDVLPSDEILTSNHDRYADIDDEGEINIPFSDLHHTRKKS